MIHHIVDFNGVRLAKTKKAAVKESPFTLMLVISHFGKAKILAVIV